MVFTTPNLLRRILNTGPVKGHDRYWKKRRIFRMSAHFFGRSQNCYKLAYSAVRRALRFATQARKVKAKDRKELATIRINAACEEHGFTYRYFKESLIRSNVLLNHKILADLAIWEPRTFKCLTEFAWKKASDEGLKGINDLGDPPEGVILRPMIIK